MLKNLCRRHGGQQAGFSTLEMTGGMIISLALLTLALPSLANATRSHNLSGAARVIAGQVTLTRTRAAAGFTQARVNVDLTAGTYKVEVCAIKNLATGGCSTFTAEGGTQSLPSGITFSFGPISLPAGTQSSIGQTGSILFNSRGAPIDASTLGSTGNDALYLRNTLGQYYAVTVSANGRVAIWRYDQVGTPAWKRA